MSKLTMVEQSSAPSSPASGKGVIYISQSPDLLLKDDAGLVIKPPYRKGSDVASATTTDLDAATGDLVDVTGTTTITAITLAEGKQCTVRFTGSLILTHGASLILPNNGGNISTAAGDIAVFRGYATSVVRCISYTRLAGTSLQSTSPEWEYNARSTAYTVDSTDIGKIIDCTSTFTLSLTAAATLGSGFWCWVRNSGTGVITIDPNGTETIHVPGGAQTPATTMTLPYSGSTEGPYNVSGVLISSDGSNWKVIATSEAHGSQTFTAGGTWTAPAGVTTAWVSGGGAGGGGGGATATDVTNSFAAGGGGASGDLAVDTRVTTVPGTGYTVSIGTGGTAGASGGGTGGTGGTSSVGALISLAGGAGGVGADATGADTAAGLGGDAGTTGNDGGNGIYTGATYGQAGDGAVGFVGGGTRGGTPPVDTATAGRSAGNNTCGGGSGAMAQSTGGNNRQAAGGVGGSGIIIIRW